MSAPEASSAKPKSKKKLIIIVLAVVVLLAAAGGGALFFLKKSHGDDEDEEAAETSHSAPAKADGAPPTFLPIENMVVNLADPGGDRFAQIGITLQVADAKASDQLKAHMPTIRSAILLLASQRTAEELLQRDGKEKLAKDVFAEASRPFGYAPEDDEDEAADAKKKKKKSKPKNQAGNPVKGVFFSSFIIQ